VCRASYKNRPDGLLGENVPAVARHTHCSEHFGLACCCKHRHCGRPRINIGGQIKSGSRASSLLTAYISWQGAAVCTSLDTAIGPIPSSCAVEKHQHGAAAPTLPLPYEIRERDLEAAKAHMTGG